MTGPIARCRGSPHEIGTETVAATAVPVSGADRDRIYGIQAERYPGFAGYQAGTGRVIPVVALSVGRP